MLSPPPGPDLCYLLGFCQTSAGITSPTNLLFLATALIAGAFVLRAGKRKRGREHNGPLS